jgi:hypothetical protein
MFFNSLILKMLPLKDTEPIHSSRFKHIMGNIYNFLIAS